MGGWCERGLGGIAEKNLTIRAILTIEKKKRSSRFTVDPTKLPQTAGNLDGMSKRRSSVAIKSSSWARWNQVANLSRFLYFSSFYGRVLVDFLTTHVELSIRPISAIKDRSRGPREPPIDANEAANTL